MESLLAINDVYLVPKGEQIPQDYLPVLIERYKTTRLAALQLDPAAFGSSYAREIQFTYETWLSRVLNTLSKTLVSTEAVSMRPAEDLPLNNLLHNEWLGTLTMLGPKVLPDTKNDPNATIWNTYTRENGNEPPDLTAVKDNNALYMIFGVFVQPNHRREGRGQRLVQAAVRAARDEAKSAGASKVIIALEVNTENRAACRLYESAGFLVVDGGRTGFRGMIWEENFNST